MILGKFDPFERAQTGWKRNSNHGGTNRGTKRGTRRGTKHGCG